MCGAALPVSLVEQMETAILKEKPLSSVFLHFVAAVSGGFMLSASGVFFRV
jgi:hypothetical protein